MKFGNILLQILLYEAHLQKTNFGSEIFYQIFFTVSSASTANLLPTRFVMIVIKGLILTLTWE